MPKFTHSEFVGVAFERVKPIVQKINNGGFPMGVLNLFSKLPSEVNYPDVKLAIEISNSLWNQLSQLIESEPALREYNFEFEAQPRGRGATVIFTYSPKDIRGLTLPSKTVQSDDLENLTNFPTEDDQSPE